MNTLTWNHTRKGTPMAVAGSFGALMVRVWMVRHVFPNHPMFMNGKPV